MGLSSISIRFNEIGNALIETAYAEYGSAIEVIAASKKANNPSLRSGYIRHAIDEYRHTATFLKLVEIEKLFERKANSGEWCNGSTTGSEPVSPGSNPGSPACLHRARRLILTKPFYARVNCG